MNTKRARTWGAVLAFVLVFGFGSAVFAADPAGSNPISNPLTGTIPVTAEDKTGWVALTWVTGPPASARVNAPFTVAVNTENMTGATIGKVLFIVDLRKGGIAATPADVTIIGTDPRDAPVGGTWPLGYDATGQFFYWGPREGFLMAIGNLTSSFVVTFLQVGNYTLNIYAVQLPLP